MASHPREDPDDSGKESPKSNFRDFPGGPVVKTSPSNAGGVDRIPGQGAKIPHAFGPKTKTKT